MFIYNISKVFSSVAGIHGESRFISLLKNLPSGVVVYRKNTSVVYSNPVAAELFGVHCDELKGMFSNDKEWHFLREDGSLLPIEEHPVSRVLSTGKPFENMILGINHRKNPKWVICNAYLIEEDNSVVSLFMDITDLKITGELLAISEDKYKKAFRLSHDAICITRLIDGRIISVNKAFEELSGYSEEELKGNSTLILWKRYNDRAEMVSRIKNTGHVYDFESSFIRKDGVCIRASLNGSLITIAEEDCILTSLKELHRRRGKDRRIHSEV